MGMRSVPGLGAEPTGGALRPTAMRIRTATLGVTLATLTGCGAAGTGAPGASPTSAAVTSDTRTASASTSPMSLSTSPTAATRSGVASASPSVPPEFATACGKPGISIVVRQVPVTVRHRDCDLTGVTISLRDDGTGMPVPGLGEEARSQPDVEAGYPQPAGLDIAVDAKTGDVTVSSY